VYKNLNIDPGWLSAAQAVSQRYWHWGFQQVC